MEKLFGHNMQVMIISETGYYDNDATKNDINIYGKFNYDINSNISAYVDLQQRFISYDFIGLDHDGSPLDQIAELSFFNPKAGMNYNSKQK